MQNVRFGGCGAQKRGKRKARENVIKTYGAEVEFLDVELNGISSTEIRLRYQFGLSNADSVPLKSRRLYFGFSRILAVFFHD